MKKERKDQSKQLRQIIFFQYLNPLKGEPSIFGLDIGYFFTSQDYFLLQACRTINYNSSFRQKMQEIPQLTFKQPLSHSLTHSHLADENLDMVTLHCRRDHLSPSFHENTSSSCYKSSYSPAKGSTNYNSPDVEKGLSRFRKYQNSTGMLPGIPKISEGSQYQKSYHGHSQEKPQKSKEKQSFFLKYNWALDPTSNYQKDYLVKNPSQINKDNGQRVNHNNLTVFKLKQKPFNSSNYRSNFKAFTIKKEAELCLGAVKDHLQGAQSRISEYQRRYDSVMELTKNKENKLSLYGRNVISRKPKNL